MVELLYEEKKVNIFKTATLAVFVVSFPSLVVAFDNSEFFEERVTCVESGLAIIYLPENFEDMSAGGLFPEDETVNGSIVSFEKGAEPFMLNGELYHYVDAETFPSLDGNTSRFTQGLMRVSDMAALGECPW